MAIQEGGELDFFENFKTFSYRFEILLKGSKLELNIKCKYEYWK